MVYVNHVAMEWLMKILAFFQSALLLQMSFYGQVTQRLTNDVKNAHHWTLEHWKCDLWSNETCLYVWQLIGRILIRKLIRLWDAGIGCRFEPQLSLNHCFLGLETWPAIPTDGGQCDSLTSFRVHQGSCGQCVGYHHLCMVEMQCKRLQSSRIWNSTKYRPLTI